MRIDFRDGASVPIGPKPFANLETNRIFEDIWQIRNTSVRFSGSMYDNLRQPGVFENLATWTKNDKNQMKRAVLARLRLDDLLSHDSMEASDARLVVSFSDILDGRLFTLFEPQDLQGLKLEIVCPRIIAGDTSSAVMRTIRGWIQKENGHGLPAFFMAAPNGFSRTDISDSLEARHDLNVVTLSDAIEVVKQAGLSEEHAEELSRHWYYWNQAIAEGRFRLTPFPKAPASALPALQAILNHEPRTLWETYSIDDRGIDIFGEALRCLEESGGKRDRPVRFLEKQPINEQLNTVKLIFFHHMFEAIAAGNNAVPEHSISVGRADNYASSAKYLDKLDSYEAASGRIRLDERIVSGLGDLKASDYERIKNSIAPSIITGIAQFKENRDTSKLSVAFDKLASEVNKDLLYVFGKSADELFRTYIWPATGTAGGAMAGTALRILLGLDGSDAGMIAVGTGAFVGKVAADAAKKPVGDAAESLSRRLFKKSLVRTATKELAG